MAEDHYKELLDRLEEEFAGLKIDMDALYEGMRERLNRSPKFPFVLSAHALARFENDFCNPGNQHLYPVDGEWYFIHGDIDN